MKMSDLILKHREDPETHQTGLVIWQTPTGPLYRVRQLSRSFFVETFVESGWVELIQLSGERNHISTPEQAMEIWLAIQTLPEQDDQEPA